MFQLHHVVQLHGAAAGTWESLTDMPVALGEVSAGLLVSENNQTVLVVLGEGGLRVGADVSQQNATKQLASQLTAPMLIGLGA